MPWKSSSPGCPCCDDDCLIPIEGFEIWSSLTWDYSNPDLITTTDSDALLTAYPDHPEDKSTHVVEVTVRGEDDGDILRVVVTFFNDDNYLYAEIEVGTVKGYLRLFQVTGGSAFQLGDDVEVNSLGPAADHTVKVCYDGEVLKAIVNAGTLTAKSYARLVTATGEYVGVATGSITDEATFKNFRWWIHYYAGGYYGEANDCPNCISDDDDILFNDCYQNACNDTYGLPKYLKVTISGIFASPGSSLVCTDCASNFEGTFLLEFNTLSTTQCSWFIAWESGPDVCTQFGDSSLVFDDLIRVSVVSVFTGAQFITRVSCVIQRSYTGMTNYSRISFSTDLGPTPDDCELNNLELDWSSNSNNGMSRACAGDGDSTCIVSRV